MAPAASRQLVVFDFDDSIVDCNSDTWINVLAPEAKIPAEILDTFDGQNWTIYMSKVFAFLFDCGIEREDYAKVLKKMPLIEGLKDLILNLNNRTLESQEELQVSSPSPASSEPEDGSLSEEKKYEMIIISDANAFFINTLLEYHGLLSAFRKIYTNPASFDAQGCLRIEEYQQQDWCKLSAANLCKGYVLEEYLKKRKADGVTFSRISYVGDGQNDLCPALRLLRPEDVTFARKGFSLEKILVNEGSAYGLKGKTCFWENGHQILKFLGESSYQPTGNEKEAANKVEEIKSIVAATTVPSESPPTPSPVVPPTPPPSPSPLHLQEQ